VCSIGWDADQFGFVVLEDCLSDECVNELSSQLFEKLSEPQQVLILDHFTRQSSVGVGMSEFYPDQLYSIGTTGSKTIGSRLTSPSFLTGIAASLMSLCEVKRLPGIYLSLALNQQFGRPEFSTMSLRQFEKALNQLCPACPSSPTVDAYKKILGRPRIIPSSHALFQ
jgi:hypothetical protein